MHENSPLLSQFLIRTKCDHLDEGWQNIFMKEFKKDYFQNLLKFLAQEKDQEIYPADQYIFNAMHHCAFKDIKIVLIGQDPYHGENQAHGLSFSVENDVKIPPSLKNIFKEINHDIGCSLIKNGNLTPWAQQGTLLLNSILTVRKSAAGSHQKKGWEEFTDTLIHHISQKHNNIIFLLWGSYAQKKANIIDRSKHLILEAAHPSPLSAHRGFFECAHFSKANAYLKQNGKKPIKW